MQALARRAMDYYCLSVFFSPTRAKKRPTKEEKCPAAAGESCVLRKS
jgi:hypothetical protein